MPKTQRIQRGNRTGAASAAERTREMLQGPQEFPPTSGDPLEMARAREDYARNGEPVGSIVPQAGAAPAASAELGPQTLLMDKLGERLADCCQRRRHDRGLFGVVEPDDREVFWDAQASFARGLDRSDCELVVERKDRGRSFW